MTVEEQIIYLNETVWCRLAPSKIHGLGVFAIRDINKGTLVWRRYGSLFNVPRDMFDQIDQAVRELILTLHLFSETSVFFYSPNDIVMLMAFMNHANPPNTDENAALRDIAKGEEITENYEINGGFGLSHFSRSHFPF